MLYKCTSLFLMVFIHYFYHKESRRIKGVKMYLQLLSTLNFTKDQLCPTAQFLGMKNETAFTVITGLTYWEDGHRRNVLTAFPLGISNLKKRK